MISFRMALTALLLAGVTAPAQAQAPDGPAEPGRAGVTRPASGGKDGVTRPAPGGSPHEEDEHPGAAAPGGRSAAPS